MVPTECDPKLGLNFSFIPTKYFPWDLLPTSVDVGCSKNRKPKVDDIEKQLMFRHRGDTPEPHQVWYHLPQQGRSTRQVRPWPYRFLSKKKKVSCTPPLMKASLEKPDSHMHVCTRAWTTIKVQSSNSEYVLAVESRDWLSTLSTASRASLVVLPKLVKYLTNLSVISFQDASSANPKLSVALFKWLRWKSRSGGTS